MKKKNLLLITIIILLFFTSSCDLFQKKDKSPIQFIDFKIKRDISSSIDVIDNSTKEIEKSANNILKISQEIKISEEIQSDIKLIKNNVNIIKEENIKIKNIISSLKIVINKIDEIEKLSKQLEKERNEISKKLRIAEESAKAETRKVLQRIIFFSILGFGGSVALMLLGNAKLGIVGIGGSLSTLLLAIVINQHIVLISWVGMGIIVLILLYLIYQSFIQGKIKRELIETTEMVKTALGKDKKEELFGKKSEVKRIQSSKTEAEVKRIKSKIKKGVSKNT